MTSGKWKRFIDSSLAAATFAEADAPELAREFLVGGDSKELVLFASRAGSISARAIRQAVNLCRRLDCGLALLLVHPPESIPEEVRLPPELRRQIEVPFTFQRFNGSMAEGVQEFMARNSRVISVVLEDSRPEDRTGRRPPKRRQHSWWQGLSCPVVVVPASQEG